MIVRASVKKRRLVRWHDMASVLGHQQTVDSSLPCSQHSTRSEAKVAADDSDQ